MKSASPQPQCARVRMNAPWFASQKGADPKVLQQDSDALAVYGVKPIISGGAVKFTY